MPGALPEIPQMDDKPLPASRPPRGEKLRGRLPSGSGRVHRRDPDSGVWVEVDELAPVDGFDESEDEFSALLRDAEAQVAKLRADRARLALPSLSDPKVHAELLDVESRLHAAKAELERIPLARQETVRREAERLAQEEGKERQLAQTAADKLAGQRHKAAREFDRAALEMARALVRFEALGGELEQQLRKAGHPAGTGSSPGWATTNALRAALGAAGARHNAIELPPITGDPRPLAGVEPEAQ